MMASLCFVVMYIASVTEIFDLSAAVVCSMIIIIAVIETGKVYPWLIWLVTGILCMLFIPKKDIALEVVLFGGIYPMIKSYVERLRPLPSWILKLLFFNAVFTVWYFLSKYLFMLDVGMALDVIAYVAANVFFVLADLCFTVMIPVYVNKLRPRMRIGKRK